MITERDLQEAIAECEGQRNPNAGTCMKLAAYYTILNQKNGSQVDDINKYSFSSGLASPIEYFSDTEFSEVIHGRELNEVFQVIDELMTTLQIVNPRLYDGVMRKLQ